MQNEPRSSSPVAGWGRIEVERLGGLAGYGIAGSRIRSRGHILAMDLTPVEQSALRTLFIEPCEGPARIRDGFRYQLTRQSDCGPQTVIAAEAVVPDVIRACVRDEIIS